MGVNTWSRQRELLVDDIDTAQGLAGTAYVKGTPLEAAVGFPAFDRNFSDTMLAQWTERRTAQSVTCIPVLDSEAWLPIGVGFVSSNLKAPFWTKLNEAERLDLYRFVRSLYRELLAYPRRGS